MLILKFCTFAAIVSGFDYDESDIRTVTLDELGKFQMSWVVDNEGKDIVFSVS